MTAKTRGEEIFAEYLHSLGLPFDYEPPIGQRRPDFLVHSPCGDVFCEVKDLGVGEYRTGLRIERIQGRIRRATEKLREFKGRYPCLVVLFDDSAEVVLVDFTVLSAMFGDIVVTIPVGHDEEASTHFDYDSRYLTRNSNTVVSAVAILEYVSPLQRQFDEALSSRTAAGPLTASPGLSANSVRSILGFSTECRACT